MNGPWIVAALIVGYALVALVVMRAAYPVLHNNGWSDADQLAVLLGLLWPLTVAGFVFFGGLKLAFDLLGSWAKGGTP